VNDWLLWNFMIEPHGIDQQVIGSGVQKQDCFVHCGARCVVNIDLVDAGSVDSRNGPRDGVFANALCENLALFSRKQLESRKPRMW
jgi:hypothetical protein